MRGRAISALFLAAIVAAAQTGESSGPAADAWQVRLLSPLSTQFNRAGDIVSARVVNPAAFQGGILEGEIRNVKTGDSSGKSATVQFDFHTLHMANEALPVSVVLVATLNSQRQAGVDEDGAVLESGIRGLGGKRAGGVSSHGWSLRLAAKVANLSLAPGSEFVLQVQIRKGRGASN
jgi:hypothetical protein